MRAARSLPMPGISRKAAASSAARSCGWLAAMSAALRYARILKGLSFLISSRSAISRKILAIAWLSNPQAFRLDLVLEQPRAPGRERRGDRDLRVGRPVTNQTPAAARAAHLGPRCPGRHRTGDEIVD